MDGRLYWINLAQDRWAPVNTEKNLNSLPYRGFLD